MLEEKKSKLFFLGIFPRCPFYTSVNISLIIVLIALGTVGIYFLNLWAAVAYLIYAISWYFLVQPVVHCQHCYYHTKETIEESTTGKTIENLMPKEQWVELCLQKHVESGKKWGFNSFVAWFTPIILIVISFFLSFSIFALITLIGFLVVLAVMLYHMRYKVCPTCAIMEECHAAF